MTEPDPNEPSIPADLSVPPPLLSAGGSDDLDRAMSSSRRPATAARHGPSFTVIRELGKEATPPLVKPIALAIRHDGGIVVLDRPESGRYRITTFPTEGAAASLSIDRGTGDQQLRVPTALAVDAHSNFYIADADANGVKKFGPDGGWLASFTTAGFEGSAFSGPRSVAIDAAGNVIVADTNNNRIVALLPDGELAWELEQFAGPEGPDDEFYEPASVCVAGLRIAVADTNNNRVLLFDAERKFLVAPDATNFVYPSAVWLSADGGTLVAGDQGNLRVRRYDAAGKRTGELALAEKFSDAPVVPGGSQLALDADGHVVLVQPLRQTIVVLDFVGGAS